MVDLNVTKRTAVTYACTWLGEDEEYLETQYDLIDKWAEENGVEVIGDFEDVDRVLRYTDSLENMMEMVRKDKVDYLIITDPTRLAHDNHTIKEIMNSLFSSYTKIIYADEELYNADFTQKPDWYRDGDSEELYAIGYTRISTDETKQNNKTQRSLIEKFCESHKINLVGVVYDKLTGFTSNRKGFKEIIDIIDNQPKDKPISLIVIEDPSRFSRDLHDIEKFLDFFDELGCRVVFCSDPQVNIYTTYGKLWLYSAVGFGRMKTMIDDLHDSIVMRELSSKENLRDPIPETLEGIRNLADELVYYAGLGYSKNEIHRYAHIATATMNNALDKAGRRHDFYEAYYTATLRIAKREGIVWKPKITSDKDGRRSK